MALSKVCATGPRLTKSFTSVSMSIPTESSRSLMSVCCYNPSPTHWPSGIFKEKNTTHHGASSQIMNQESYSYGERYATNPLPKYNMASKVIKNRRKWACIENFSISRALVQMLLTGSSMTNSVLVNICLCNNSYIGLTLLRWIDYPQSGIVREHLDAAPSWFACAREYI
jgi:hypothetical protein